jgi:hypothetical protein
MNTDQKKVVREIMDAIMGDVREITAGRAAPPPREAAQRLHDAMSEWMAAGQRLAVQADHVLTFKALSVSPEDYQLLVDHYGQPVTVCGVPIVADDELAEPGQ